jgi:SAM-dependent methyltransferase
MSPSEESGRMDQSLEARDRELFNRIAQSYVRKDLARASRVARRQRVLATIRSVPLPKDARILEVGCGAGFGAEYLRGRYGQYVGIDYADNLIAFASSENKQENTEFVATNARDFHPSESFDLIFMVGVLHHMSDRRGILQHLSGLLRPGGWLAVNEPQPANPLISWARRMRARWDDGYSSEQEELWKRELVEDFLSAGFTSVRTRGQGLLSTPFAEVMLRPGVIATPLAYASVGFDVCAEATAPGLVSRISWNIIAAAQR